MVRALTRLTGLVLVAVAIALAVAARVRPYADNQRNWLVIGAITAVLAALAMLASTSALHGLREFWRKVRNEWSDDS